MTAVLAAIGRAAIAAVLLLIVLASALLTAFGPQGAWTLAWVLLVAVVVSCAVLAWFALPKGDGNRG